MRQSRLFTKTRREAPKDEISKNAELLIRGGFIHKEMAGAYDYLPLGLRVFKRIEQIIREEMNAIGGQELIMTTLQDPEIWKASGRWSDDAVDIWFKSHLKNGQEVGIANTHEETLARILKQHLHSYTDLPLYIYQFQNKFRNELRAKSGIMRGREFVMKDLYSFSENEKAFREFYEICAGAYERIFSRVGIVDVTFRTFASGGSFSKYSDEFQTLSSAGEDTIYLSRKKKIAVNKEVYTDDVLAELGLSKGELTEERSIEVGNIFPLGTRFPEAIGLTYKNEQGESQYPVMGSYGIGLGRLMGTIVEVLSDEKGIVWPQSVAPFSLHLVALSGAERETDALYDKLIASRAEVLYDDRDLSPGEKFADSDLMGIPKRVIISPKRLAEGTLEVVDRASGHVSFVTEAELLKTT